MTCVWQLRPPRHKPTLVLRLPWFLSLLWCYLYYGAVISTVVLALLWPHLCYIISSTMVSSLLWSHLCRAVPGTILHFTAANIIPCQFQLLIAIIHDCNSRFALSHLPRPLKPDDLHNGTWYLVYRKVYRKILRHWKHSSPFVPPTFYLLPSTFYLIPGTRCSIHTRDEGVPCYLLVSLSPFYLSCHHAIMLSCYHAIMRRGKRFQVPPTAPPSRYAPG